MNTNRSSTSNASNPSTQTSKLNAPKFLVMTTGGTIASTSTTGNDKRYTPTEGGESLLDKLLIYAPAFKEYELRTRAIKQMDSKDMHLGDFMDIHDALITELNAMDAQDDRYESITLLCGTDNMENLAFFLQLSLHLSAFKTPIILTGAMLPASSAHFDGLKNLYDAILWGQAIRNTQQQKLGNIIYAAMNGQLLAPHLQIKKHTTSLATFDDASHLAMISDSVWPLNLFTQSHPLGDIFLNYHQKIFTQFPLDFRDARTRERFLSWKIEQVEAAFDQDRDLFKALRLPQEDFYTIDALIIQGTGNGTYPSSWDDALEKLKINNSNRFVPVIRASQCNQGDVDWQSTDTTLACGYLTAKKVRLLLRTFLTFTHDHANIKMEEIQHILNESVMNVVLDAKN